MAAPKTEGGMSTVALHQVAIARMEALDKYGPLKPGADRWSRLIAEEWQEVEDELRTLYVLADHGEEPVQAEELQYRDRAINELAQLAQLCIGAIELLQQEGQQWASR